VETSYLLLLLLFVDSFTLEEMNLSYTIFVYGLSIVIPLKPTFCLIHSNQERVNLMMTFEEDDSTVVAVLGWLACVCVCFTPINKTRRQKLNFLSTRARDSYILYST
jgi:hypothetical protein